MDKARHIAHCLRVLLLCACLIAFGKFAVAQNNSKKPAVPTVTVETYRAQLQRALRRLRAMEENPPHRLAPVLQSLAKTQKIKRSDGQTQTASGDEWSRRLSDVKPNVSRSELVKLRDTLELRLRAFDEWSASTYSPADAQSIVRQLEGSGQIRTGPTWLQQLAADVSKWLREALQNFMKWFAGLFPSATPGKMPSVDPRWIQALFALTVFALLALLAFLVWRALSGRWSRCGARRGVLAEGEDAELLLLPPDELREHARRFAAENNYREALRHLYVSLLLTLDARGVWRYDARRTNWEHIRSLRGDGARANLIAPLSQITRVFDRVRYGNADFEADDWHSFESDVTNVETQTANA